MSRRSVGTAPWSIPIPLNTLSIGLWEDDVAADCIRGDAVVARLYGLPEEEFAAGITRAHLLSLFHPNDAIQDPELSRSVREAGGLFVWEHRIVPAPGTVRWVLARGHFERGADGRMRGRGIIIDMTDARMDGHAEGPARFMGVMDAADTVVERMADHALQLMELVRGLDATAADKVRPLIEVVLFEIGRQIAASLPEGVIATTSSPSRRDPNLH